jgi:hypothetical protein
MRVELGRFARSFAARRKEQERAVTQPPPPKAALARTFDELVEEEAMPAPTRAVKQRIASRGASAAGGGSRIRSLTARGEGIRAA